MKRWSQRGAVAAALLGTLIGGVATAQDLADMLVTATVEDGCELRTIPTIAFGVLDQAADNDTDGNIGWVCTIGFDTEIRLDGGNTGDIDARAMSDGGNTLGYQLYTDTGRNTVFGDGVTGAVAPVTGAGYATEGFVTVYGRVPAAAAELAAPGTYTDTVTVTIVF